MCLFEGPCEQAQTSSFAWESAVALSRAHSVLLSDLHSFPQLPLCRFTAWLSWMWPVRPRHWRLFEKHAWELLCMHFSNDTWVDNPNTPFLQSSLLHLIFIAGPFILIYRNKFILLVTSVILLLTHWLILWLIIGWNLNIFDRPY